MMWGNVNVLRMPGRDVQPYVTVEGDTPTLPLKGDVPRRLNVDGKVIPSLRAERGSPIWRLISEDGYGR